MYPLSYASACQWERASYMTSYRNRQPLTDRQTFVAGDYVSDPYIFAKFDENPSTAAPVEMSKYITKIFNFNFDNPRLYVVALCDCVLPFKPVNWLHFINCPVSSKKKYIGPIMLMMVNSVRITSPTGTDSITEPELLVLIPITVPENVPRDLFHGLRDSCRIFCTNQVPVLFSTFFSFGSWCNRFGRQSGFWRTLSIFNVTYCNILKSQLKTDLSVFPYNTADDSVIR